MRFIATIPDWIVDSFMVLCFVSLDAFTAVPLQEACELHIGRTDHAESLGDISSVNGILDST